jgi:hypothetical protein
MVQILMISGLVPVLVPSSDLNGLFQDRVETVMHALCFMLLSVTCG